MIIWEKYVKKYVWDDDKTPYFIPASKLKRDQADKEIFLYCFFLAVPAALIVASFVSTFHARGELDSLSPGVYAASVLICVAYLKFKKSTTAALFAISAPIVLLLHFAINGFDVPNLRINASDVVAADTDSDSLTLAVAKNWQSGYSMMLTTNGSLPAPFAESTTYYLIRKTDTLSQLAASPADARAGTAIDLTDLGNGTLTLRRIVNLHWIEKIGLFVIVLLWLRYTLRVVAITKVYPGLRVRDMNPWSKLPPGAKPPRK
jgi:hypothetical protein